MAYDSSIDPRIEKLNRLYLVADALDGVPPAGYDQRAWVGEGLCGTTHCALGWAITKHGSEAMGGLGLNFTYVEGQLRGGSLELNGGSPGRVWSTLGDVFGITHVEAAAYFGSTGHAYVENAGPKEVAAALRELANLKILAIRFNS